MKLCSSLRSLWRALLAGAVPWAVLTLFPAAVGGHTLVAGDSFGEVNHWSWLGVHHQGRIKFYRYGLGVESSLRTPFWTLDLPEIADEVVHSSTRLLVRTGKNVRFFDSWMNFRPVKQYDFELPETPTELLLDGELLGVRTGSRLKFYNLTQGMKHLEKYDYVVPSGASELLIVRNRAKNWLGVRVGTRLTFHDINRDYRAYEGGAFMLSPDVEETVVVGLHLLVKAGDSVAFHDFRKNRMTEPRHVVRMEPTTLPDLKSLHGMSFAVFGGDTSGLPAEIWAKGDNYRAESALGHGRIITIQRGDTIDVSEEGSNAWNRRVLQPGLPAMGLVRQVAEVKAHGRRQGAEVIDGILHYRFIYDREAPRERVIAFISSTNSLPRIWISTVELDDGTQSLMRMFFRDLEANVEIPDAMFTLPPGATISN